MIAYLCSLSSRFLRRAQIDRDLADELRAHVDLRAEALERTGLAPTEARRQAQIEFGNTERFKEECRDALGGNWIDQLAQDLRFSIRSLRKSPAFFAVAIVTLALGIGATVAAFSIVNTVLLRPFAFRDPTRLLWIYSQRPDNARTNFALPEYCDYRDQQTLFESLGAVAAFNPTFSDNAQTERVQGVRLTANAFSILGVRPLVGRSLVLEDDRNGAPLVAMISYALWARHYGKSEDVVGRSANLNGEVREIVGVLPPNFILPNLDTDVVVPMQPDSDPRRNARNSTNFLRMFGRLKPDVTASQGQAELDAIRQNLHRQFPEMDPGKIGITVVPVAEEIVGNVRGVLITIFCAAAAVLLIGCTNLAGISIARATARQRELAVRGALGATRSQLVRLLLTESGILAVIGGSLGICLEIFGRSAFLRLIPSDLPRIETLSVDWIVLGFAVAVTLIVATACGLAPALLLSREDVRNALVSGSRGSTVNTRRLRTALVAGQIALALVLLANAGVLLRSFVRLNSEKPGFDPTNVYALRFSLPQNAYTDLESITRFYDQLHPRLAGLPGTEHVGFVSILPLAPKSLAFIHFIRPDQPPAKPEDRPAANYRAVSPDYFRTMGIPLVTGRFLTEQDDSNRRPVTLISAVLANKFFPDRSPIGQRLLLDDTDGEPRPVEIVGVVGAVKQVKLETPAAPDLYLPLRQVPKDGVPWLRNSAYWVLKTSGTTPNDSLLRAEVRKVDASVAAGDVRSMTEVMAAAVAARRFSLLLVGSFAGAALFLAAAGLYAVIAYGIEQRTREIGVRLALGATRRNILSLILREGAVLLAAGVAAGMAIALLLAKLVANQLYGVSERDPLSFLSVSILVGVVSLGACVIAARRATRVDPVVALRCE